MRFESGFVKKRFAKNWRGKKKIEAAAHWPINKVGLGRNNQQQKKPDRAELFLFFRCLFFSVRSTFIEKQKQTKTKQKSASNFLSFGRRSLPTDGERIIFFVRFAVAVAVDVVVVVVVAVVVAVAVVVVV